MSSDVTRRSFIKIAGLSALSTLGGGMPGLLETRSFAREAGSPLVKSNCPLCPQGCGIDLFIEDGKLTQVRGMIEDPETRGMLCDRGKTLPEVIGSEKRVLTPLKKSGEKGKEEFIPISWEEALSTVTQRWTQIILEDGAHAIAGYLGNNLTMEAYWLLPRLLFALGSPNVFLPVGQDESAWGWAGEFTVGSFPTVSFEQVDKTNCIVLWGHNPDDSTPCTTPRWIREQRKRGAKLVVIDPRKTPLAEEADAWISLKPGTDGALAWSMAQVIIKENLYDADFIEKWTEGFEGFKEIALREEYQPEKVAALCGIQAGQIESVARLYANNAPSLILGGSGGSLHGSGLQNYRAVHCLAPLTGNVNKPGSNLYYSYPLEPAAGLASLRDRVEQTGILEKQLVKLPLGYSDSVRLWDLLLAGDDDLSWKNTIFRQALSEGKAPYSHTGVYASGHEGQAYSLKSLIVLESDPLGELPEPLKGRMALKELPFMVAITPFLNETARFADVIFPAAISPESTNLVSCHLPVSRHYLRVRKKALAPRGQSKSYQTTIGLLAAALGAGKLFDFNEESFINLLFKSSPFTQEHSYEKLSASPLPMVPLYRVRDLFPHPHRKSFDTPSGKVMFRSSSLFQMGFNPYPEWSPPLEGKILTPDYFTRYPLLLVTGRILEGKNPEGNGCVLIHSRDARTLNLAEGAEVWVESKVNKIKRKLKISEDIAPGVVWIPLEKNPLRDKEAVEGTAVNYLVDARNNDPVCGAARFNEMLVKVYPA